MEIVKDMIEICDRNQCCGCNACGDVCPQGAISFVRDEEGFLYPEVDAVKCVECGACIKVCPAIHVAKMRNEKEDSPQCFAAVNKDFDVRFDSTSGGVFSACASIIYRKGGFVGGAIWGKGFCIQQYISNNEKDLPRLRSSKYAQSDARGFYNAVKAAVKTGRPVLVCGTPCQMAALRLFLGTVYDNLVVVDFICRGSNSPLIFQKYIESVEKEHGGKIVAVKQKNKELGWRRLTTKFTFDDGSVVYDPRERSLYMRGYLISNAFCRKSCYDCQFKVFPRIADITLGDCWHVADGLSRVFNDNAGTSVVLCNTSKGHSFWEELKSELQSRMVKIEEVIKGNQMLVKSLPAPKMPREEFYRQIRDVGFVQTMNSLLQSNQRSFFSKIRGTLRTIRRYRFQLIGIVKATGFRRTFWGEGILVPHGNVCIQRDSTSELNLSGLVRFGTSLYKKSRIESRLLCSPKAVLRLGRSTFSHGCDIQLFEGGRLEIGENWYSNIGLEIVCAQHIRIGRDCLAGRHVRIRDTNGHVMVSRDYRVSAPVEIGDHVWLCDDVIVMPGVKIGAGSVVAARSVVTQDVPANSLVAGIPARVVRSDIVWKN